MRRERMGSRGLLVSLQCVARGWLFLLALLHSFCGCQGSIYMSVSPYPARIYVQAPAGIPVLTVQAQDNVAGEAITHFRLDDTESGGSNYFTINASGILSTARPIDKPLGTQFSFFVFAVGQVPALTAWKHVIIEVGEKNLYPPQFSQDSYEFSVYHYAAPGTLIGTVTASDSDTDPHNRLFAIYVPRRQSATNYVNVTPSGNVILAKAPPDKMTLLQVQVLAVDSGSPQRTGTTTALIVVENINQPDTFCLSSTDTTTTLCWKNPMPGRRHQGYNIVVQGQGLVLHMHVKGDRNADEFCVSTTDLQLGHNYTFHVTVDDADSATPPGVELSFHQLGPGYSAECTEERFNVCNFLAPCQHGGECVAEAAGGVTYTCHCTSGWQGQNCTQEDLCPTLPCHNAGVCQFTGHGNYTCQCQENYFGSTCRLFNQCVASSPCQNGGVCRMLDNGTYSCACPDYFTGQHCNVSDPCSPSPCGDRGHCVPVSEMAADCVCHPGYQGDHCDVVNICQLAPPCVNGGTCYPGPNGTFTCTCLSEYTGVKCELYNTCTLACQNNASCQVLNDGEYRCLCLPSYHGNECQYFNRCHGDPCHNGACNMHEGQPLCDCDPGFYGQLCEEYDPCLPKPCRDNGHCLRLPAGNLEQGDLPYECECYDGWWGLQCLFIDVCRQDVCQNGAQCHNTPPISYSCDCTEGYYGHQCQHRDPCLSSPCLHAGQCLNNRTHHGYTCRCPTGFTGPQCQHHTTCTIMPCANHGVCHQGQDDGTAYCACSEGFLGYYCQLPDPCFDAGGDAHGQASVVCDHGRCEVANGTVLEGEVGEVEVSGRCRCEQGYSGDRCDVPVVSPPCGEDGGPCLNSGNCRNGVCVCPPEYTGSQCETPVSLCGGEVCGEGLRCLQSGHVHLCVCGYGSGLPPCIPVCRSEETVLDKTGRYVWPEAAAGHSVEVTCPYGPHGNHSDSATRPCDLSAHNEAVWGDVDDSNCNEFGLLEASRRLSALKELTSHPASVGTSEVNNYTSILEELFAYTLMDQEVASLMLNVISNLADVNVSVTVASDQQNYTSERLLNMLDQYTADVNLTSGGNVSIATPNFEIIAISVENTSAALTYVPSVESGNSSTKQLGVSITLPPEALALQADEEEVTNRMPELPNRNRKSIRVQMAGHGKSQLFIPRRKGGDGGDGGGGDGGDGVPSPYIGETQHQPVISARVSGRQVMGLSSPVVYSITNRQTQSNYTCVFWDPKNHTWSTEGVVTVVKSGNSTVCHSQHLTSFAVLLDPSPNYVLDSTHEAILTYISYIGCGVSLFCLLLTIITYALFRSLNKDKSGKILLHLCVALLLLNAVFLVNALASEENDDDNSISISISSGVEDGQKKKEAAPEAWCRAVAVLLHYLLLASLAWMLVEAAEMYRALVTVFAKYAACYMLKRCLVGWGLPLTIVAVTLAISVDNYDAGGSFCFISRSHPGAYYGCLVAPACLVVLVNTVIFVLVSRVILRPRFQHNQQQKTAEGITPAQVRGAFTVMFLLGVTWVLGPLAIREAKVVFNYLFCILNSLQGFLIFVFRCLLNPEVRLCWLQLLKTGTLKRRRGPVRSNAYSDSSSKADGKSCTFQQASQGLASNGSSGGTIKTSLRTSNGWHPKLNGFPAEPGMQQRRGTKFSTLDLGGPGTPDSVRKSQQGALTEDQRYGDGDLQDAHIPPIFPVLDYYETGHDGHAPSATSVRYEDFHGDGGVLDYYESIRSRRKADSSHASDSQEDTLPDSQGDKGPDSQGDKGPDSQGDKGPDSQGDKGPDCQGDKGPDSQEEGKRPDDAGGHPHGDRERQQPDGAEDQAGPVSEGGQKNDADDLAFL